MELIASEFPNVVVSELATSSRSREAEIETKLGRNFKLRNGSMLEEYSIVFIGRDGPTLSNIALTYLGMSEKVHFFFEDKVLHGHFSRSPEAEVETKLIRNFRLLNGSMLEEYSVMFVGRDGPTLSNLALTFLGMFENI
jgi:hypothetical protein